MLPPGDLVDCSVSVLSSTRPGAFLARWRAVDKGEGSRLVGEP
jgi:hypothetical protein